MIEDLLDRLHVDCMEVGEKTALFTIAKCCGSTIGSQKRRLDHRWLSTLPLLSQLLEDIDLLTLFYSAFATDSYSHSELQEIVSEIFDRRSVTTSGKAEILSIIKFWQGKWRSASGSNQQKATLARRKTIVDCLLANRKVLDMVYEIYCSRLSVLNSFVKLYQSGTPLVHQMHSDMHQLVRKWCAFFIKHEFFSETASASILEEGNQICLRKMFDDTTSKESFIRQAEIFKLEQLQSLYLKASQNCASYLIKNLPLDNALMKSFRGLDPRTTFTEANVDDLLSLVNSLAACTGLTKEEVALCKSKVRQFACSSDLPTPVMTEDTKVPVDLWWSEVISMKDPGGKERYPILSRIARSVLSCFNGPKVESVFTAMNITTTKCRSSLSVPSLSATLTCLYRKRIYGDAVAQFGKANPMEEPVSQALMTSMRQSWKKRKERLAQKKKEKNDACFLTREKKIQLQNLSKQRLKMAKSRRQRLIALQRLCQQRRERLMRMKIPKKIPRQDEDVASETSSKASSPENTDDAPFPCPPPPKKLRQTTLSGFFSSR